MNLTNRIFYRLPYFAQVWAASLAGYQREWRRYDASLEQRVEEILAREGWSAEQWQNWQSERLEQILDHAAKTVPFYSSFWMERRLHGDYAKHNDLAKWPILTKKYLREHPKAFVSRESSFRNLHEEHTSGSTGTPLTLWRSNETEKAWYAVFEARLRRWYGVHHKTPWGIFGGQIIVPADRKKPPFWVWNHASQQLYLSVYHLSVDNSPAYAQAILRKGLEYILGYPSALAALAANCLKAGIDLPQMRAVFTNAEPLYDWQRSAIQAAFRCPVVNTYGLSEICCAAGECAHGTLHQWPEVGRIEILGLDSNQPARIGETGRLVCTGLLNLDMPLIRYEVGDLASESLMPPCVCGRLLPAFRAIEGRSDDVLFTRDGRPIGRLDPIFKSDFDISEAQIIQREIDWIDVLLVPGKRFSEGDAQEIRQRVIERMGAITVNIEMVQSIPRGPNGKFKMVVNELFAGQVIKE